MFLFSSKKFHWKKIIFASLILTVIDFIIHQIEATITIKYYLMPEYYGLWSKLMMPKAGPPPAEFFVISILVSFLSSLVLATIFVFIKDLLPKKHSLRILGYTKITALFMLIFSYFPMFMMFNVPYVLLASWFLTSVIAIVVGACLFTKMLNK